MDTEKVCVNLSAGELGKVDVLVAQGLFVNRTDVVRAALRREFDAHAEVIDAAVERHRRSQEDSGGGGYRVSRTFTGIGATMFNAEILGELVARNERAEVVCAGIVTFAQDVTPELAAKSIHRLRVLGTVRGPRPVLDAISDRIHRNWH